MAIYVYNRRREDYSFLENNYYIGRGGILGNPYSHLPEDKCQALYKCRTREESLEKYDSYFDLLYGHNREFTQVIDEMYEKYKRGEDLYLECYCKKHPCRDTESHDDEIACHGDIIARKLQQRLIKEKISDFQKKKIQKV